MRLRILLVLLSVFALPPVQARGSLSQKQAKKAITRMAGFQLPGSAVRIKRVTDTGASSAEALIDIETAFRLAQSERGQWDVVEVRAGQDQWEETAFISAALKTDVMRDDCASPDLYAKTGGTDPSVKRSRCLLASLLGIKLPSDAVRIRDVSALGLPFGSGPSAVVVAIVEVAVRLSKDKGGWRVSELRAGNRDWINLEILLAGINAEKRQRAQKDLAVMAAALEAFRADRGSYVVSDKQPVLIDHLSPHYLARVIRLDPWHKPYQYQGERDRFILRSLGPDGKQDTPDDVVVSKASR